MPTPARATPVAVLPWPAGATARARARAGGTPRLLVVAPGAPPPTDCEHDEDWTPAAAAAGDVARRLATLESRPRSAPRLPADVLDELSDAEVAVFDVLDRHWPRAAAMATIVAADPEPANVASTLGRLRRAVRTAGYEVLAVPGGVLLARCATP